MTITETLRRVAERNTDRVSVGSDVARALVAVVEAAREVRNAERNNAAFAVIIQATRDLDAALEALAAVEG